ncbi:multisubstrate pseudouridine synthase 7 [Elasticomyces elasticus]|nr:multisubstrate pseudouridine synthase 7 [Elasticomyces elasticus]
MADREDLDEQPRKKLRLTSPSAEDGDTLGRPDSTEQRSNHASSDPQTDLELKVGINVYVSPDTPGFTGIVKQRYTDFLVNEILPSGQVVHLTDLGTKPKPTQAEKARKIEKIAASGTAIVQPLSKSSAEKAAQGSDQNDAITEPTQKVEPAAKEEKEGMHPSRVRQVAAAEAKDQTVGELRDGAIAAISVEDRSKIEDIFGEKTTKAMLNLYGNIKAKPDRKARDFNALYSDPIDDKQKRTDAHVAVRNVFSSTLETITGDDNVITIKASTPRDRNNHGRGLPQKANAPRAKGKLGWDELGGEHLHFTLYKENKDTMEIMYFIASQLKVQVKTFQFAGTKDRRGVTTQRVSAFRVYGDRISNLNRNLRQAKLGGFEYHPKGLELGDLGGNEFVITLRDCHFPGETDVDASERLGLAHVLVSRAVAHLAQRGFLNYYGLQRFGSFTIGTDVVGMKMLQEDLEGAVDAILSYVPEALIEAQNPDSTANLSTDDKARAEALHIWKTTKKVGPALDKLPRRFQAESAIIKHLGWTDRKTGEQKRSNDFQGALQNIQRNLRLMYVHAYQSLVWNVVAGKRWVTYGDKVVEGDLVIVGEQEAKTAPPAGGAGQEVDDDGEVIIRPTADDSAAAPQDPFTRARALSKEEAESGDFSIFDVVLPLPGYDVIYPPNAIGDFYKEFMGSERGGELDPHNMRRKWKDASLSGGYRKMLARPGNDLSFEVKQYTRDDEQMVETDLERLEKRKNAGRDPGMLATPEEDVHVQNGGAEKKITVVLKMQLGSSQYATMALRELMKGGAVAYRPDFHGGR